MVYLLLHKQIYLKISKSYQRSKRSNERLLGINITLFKKFFQGIWDKNVGRAIVLYYILVVEIKENEYSQRKK